MANKWKKPYQLVNLSTVTYAKELFKNSYQESFTL
jgi:hypothetical protein